MKKNSGFFLTGGLLVLFLTLLDQLTKYLAIFFLKGQKAAVLIPGVLELSYLENRGMAFGMFQGKLLFLICICLFFFAAALYVFLRIPREKYYFPLTGVILVLFSGAAGNFIDRVFRGYVVDFIYFSLINFPTFNLADVYVVCGGILLVLLVCFKYKDDRDFDFLKPKTEKKS